LGIPDKILNSENLENPNASSDLIVMSDSEDNEAAEKPDGLEDEIFIEEIK
jgi:hypothetical protein